MKQIIFPGNDKHPYEAFYGVVLTDTLSAFNAEIVVVQDTRNDGGRSGTVLSNHDDGRNNILNRIINSDLNGIRLDFIKFNLISIGADYIFGHQWGIALNYDQFIKNGGKHTKTKGQIELNPFDVVGGCADVYTDESVKNGLDDVQVSFFLEQINYKKRNFPNE